MRDEWFIRGNVPMTKEEVRAVSIAKLEIGSRQDDGKRIANGIGNSIGNSIGNGTGKNTGKGIGGILFDIGAGTGSVSVEAAVTYPELRIVAFEKKDEAISLIRQNAEKAGTEERMEIVPGNLPESLEQYVTRHPEMVPDYVFIGGATANTARILDLLRIPESGTRVVINVIALESIQEVLSALRDRKIEPEISQISVSRAEKAGAFHLMKGLNPVTVISFGGKCM